MKILIKSFFLVSLLFINSCEDNGVFVNCQECVNVEPIIAKVEIKLEIQHYGAPVTITIYEGNIEDGIIIDSFNAGGDKTSAELRINKQYTFSALYTKVDGFYTVIDSARPRVSYNKDQCDDPCYYVYDNNVNLRLKYTK